MQPHSVRLTQCSDCIVADCLFVSSKKVNSVSATGDRGLEPCWLLKVCSSKVLVHV